MLLLLLLLPFLQVFLELLGSHPNWLNTFLLEYNGPIGPSSPQVWVSDMLSWTLQSASKRCGHQLQAYVAACLRHHVILGHEQGGMGQQQQQPGQQAVAAERALRQALPPLGQALVGVVEQLVQLVHCCLPRFSQGGMIFPHEPPTEPARILLAYAESSPWAAAHLLQVCQTVSRRVLACGVCVCSRLAQGGWCDGCPGSLTTTAAGAAWKQCHFGASWQSRVSSGRLPTPRCSFPLTNAVAPLTLPPLLLLSPPLPPLLLPSPLRLRSPCRCSTLSQTWPTTCWPP